MQRILCEYDDNRTEPLYDLAGFFPDEIISFFQRLKNKQGCSVSLFVAGPGKGISGYVLSSSENRNEDSTCALVPMRNERENLLVYRAQFASSTAIVESLKQTPDGTTHLYLLLPPRPTQITARYLRALEGSLPASVECFFVVLTPSPHWTLRVPQVFDHAYTVTAMYRSDRDREMRYSLRSMDDKDELRNIPFPNAWRKREGGIG